MSDEAREYEQALSVVLAAAARVAGRTWPARATEIYNAIAIVERGTAERVPAETDAAIIAAVEHEVGMGHEAFDMVRAPDLVRAFRNALRTVPGAATEHAPDALCQDCRKVEATTERTGMATWRLCDRCAASWDRCVAHDTALAAHEGAPQETTNEQ